MSKRNEYVILGAVLAARAAMIGALIAVSAKEIRE